MTVQVGHKDLKRVIEALAEKKIGIMVWGAPGIGKSESFRQYAQEQAKKEGLKFSDKLEDIDNEKVYLYIDVRASQFESSDIRGLPNFSDSRTKWFLPNWLPTKGNGIIVFDETNLAPPLVQASLYELLYDRRLIGGQYVVPEGFTIICAGNRSEDRANIFDMAAPLCNRLAHVELTIPSKEDWSEWAISNDVDSRIIAFINARPSLIHKMDPKLKDKSFPTPRTWFFTSESIKDVKDLETIELLSSATVGEGSAKELTGFIKLQRKVDIEEILKNPESVKKLEDIDLKYSLVSLIAEHYKKNNKLLDPIISLCKYIEPEFAVLTLRFVKQLSKADYLESNLKKCKDWVSISGKFRELLL